MAEKKKAYQRFVELTKQVTAPTADEAERDRGSTGVLPIRLDPELRRALEQRAAADHTTPSDIVQAALRRYLEIGR